MQTRPATLTVLLAFSFFSPARAGTTQKHYYAHDAVEDAHGVIAPWYTGQNGQLDWRIRIAAETLKRYPWTDKTKAVAALPEFIFSGAWKIAPDGTITIPPITDWANGDLGQRAAYVLSGLIDYYRYSGDPAAIALVTLQADALLDYALTPADHPWPNFLISVPVRGKPYGQAGPHGFIQLDIVAEAGVAMVHAAEMTGNERWMQAVRHWGDLLAEKRSRVPGEPPWPRYANPRDVPWDDHMTGGVAFILEFFDALIRSGYTGKDGAIVEARKAGVAYLRDVLLPNWMVNDTWGRNYWDWPDPVQAENVTEFVVRYLMEHPEDFPNWRTDARNVLTLFLNHTSVAPGSGGDVYSGAWAYPESNSCCGRSLWYGPLELAGTFAQYGVLCSGRPPCRPDSSPSGRHPPAREAVAASSEGSCRPDPAASAWALELARRQAILATYDAHETGVVEDNIDGGPIVAGAWFKIAHPMALKYCLSVMAWMPETFGPPRENHIVRSTSTVTKVDYKRSGVDYETRVPAVLHRPEIDVLRLAFNPVKVAAGDSTLNKRSDLDASGFVVQKLYDGDYLVSIRHDEASWISVRGDDSQQDLAAGELKYSGEWVRQEIPFVGEFLYAPAMSTRSDSAGAAVEMEFTGNQVRLMGIAQPDGGLADVYLDGIKQLVPVDFWCPSVQYGVVYSRNGLPNLKHTLKLVGRGTGNPRSRGAVIRPFSVHYSSDASRPAFASGGGPTGAQRMFFGYTGREDFVDSQGNAWRPGTEFVIRSGGGADSVAASWWTNRTRLQIDNGSGGSAADVELYRYGIHGKDFWVDFTVAPGVWHARLKFAETRNIDPKLRALNIAINGREVVRNFDIAATALGQPSTRPAAPASGWGHRQWTGLNRAVDLVFNNLQPKNGVISIRFTASEGGEAIVQAIEVRPGDGGHGADPVTVAPAK